MKSVFLYIVLPLLLVGVFMSVYSAKRADAIVVGFGNVGSSGSTPTLAHKYNTDSSNVQAGISVAINNLIVVMYQYNNTKQTITCSDGVNTYSQVGTGQSVNTGGNAATGHIFYAIAASAATLTVTCTNESYAGIGVFVVSGNNATLGSVLDTSTTSSDGSAVYTHTTGTITTTYAKDYLVAYWFQEQSSNTLTENGQSFTVQLQDSGDYFNASDRVVSSTGNYVDSVSTTGSQEYGWILAAFKGQ